MAVHLRMIRNSLRHTKNSPEKRYLERVNLETNQLRSLERVNLETNLFTFRHGKTFENSTKQPEAY